MMPTNPEISPAAGNATQNGNPTLAQRIADAYPPTIMNPECPMEISPQRPVRIFRPCRLMTVMPISVIRVRMVLLT